MESARDAIKKIVYFGFAVSLLVVVFLLLPQELTEGPRLDQAGHIQFTGIITL